MIYAITLSFPKLNYRHLKTEIPTGRIKLPSLAEMASVLPLDYAGNKLNTIFELIRPVL